MLNERGKNMFFRTDLAVERREMIGERVPDGVSFEEIIDGDVKTTVIKITNENGEKALSKPVGEYITVEFGALPVEADENSEALNALKESIEKLLPESGTVLVAGLGNENITPDALGPKTVEKILATRHISDKSDSFGLPELRNVAAISTGVLGQTGMETAEIIKAICEKIKPAAVIAVDALATGSAKRLGRAVQISDTGISPGSGVNNSRSRLDETTLGTKVISVGVPTVIDALTLCPNMKKSEAGEENMMVTPRNIDSVINSMSLVLASSINLALQKNLSLSDIMALV